MMDPFAGNTTFSGNGTLIGNSTIIGNSTLFGNSNFLENNTSEYIKVRDDCSCWANYPNEICQCLKFYNFKSSEYIQDEPCPEIRPYISAISPVPGVCFDFKQNKVLYQDQATARIFHLVKMSNKSEIESFEELYNPDEPNCDPNKVFNYYEKLAGTNSLVTVIVVICFMLCLFGMVLNAVIIYIIKYHSRASRTSNVYLFHLSVSDFLMLAVLLAPLLQKLFRSWPFGHDNSKLGNLLCSLYHFGDMCQSLSVSLFILAIAADRLFLVLNNTKMRSIKISKVVSYSIWAISISFSSAGPIHELWYSFQQKEFFDEILNKNSTRYLYESEKTYMRKGRVANNFEMYGHQTPICELISDGMWGRLHSPLMFGLHILVPLPLCLICYVVLVYRVKQFTRTHSAMKSYEILVVKQTCAAMLAYVVCWMPFYVLVTVQSKKPCLMFESWFKILLESSVFLSYLQSCSNPFLYAAMSDEFRKDFCQRFLDFEMTSSAGQRGPVEPRPGTQETLLKTTKNTPNTDYEQDNL